MERVSKFRYSSAVRFRVSKSRASQGLFTAILHSGWKSPTHPQNTSAVVGNLKYRSDSIGSWVISVLRPPVPVLGKSNDDEETLFHIIAPEDEDR